MARYNRIPNPAFDNNLDGWRARNNSTALRRVASARPDGKSGYIADTRSDRYTSTVLDTVTGGHASVTPGATYTVSAYVYQGHGYSHNVKMDVDFYNSSGSYVTTAPNSPVVLVGDTTWTRLVHTVTVPSGLPMLSVYLQYATDTSNVYLAMACAMVEDGSSSPSYGDGDYPGWSWDGTRGSSPSRMLDPPTVGAGADATVTVGTTFTRTGTDTGNGATVTARSWRVISGPAQVGATLSSSAELSWTPAAAGTYVLRYSATSSAGTGTDDVTVTVVRPLYAPTVNAGADAEVTTGTAFTRTGTENDGGATITARSWRVVSGPAQTGATLSSSAALSWTPATAGTYVLRFSATNSVGTGTDDVTVTVTVTGPEPGRMLLAT